MAGNATLRTIRDAHGAHLSAPAAWRPSSPVRFNQSVCVGGSCADVQEQLVLAISPDQQQTAGVFGLDLPAGSRLDASAVLPQTLRGAFAALATRASDLRIVSGPDSIAVPNADSALQEQGSFTGPTGDPSTIVVIVAARGPYVSGAMLAVTDDFLQAHPEQIEQMRSSFELPPSTD